MTGSGAALPLKLSVLPGTMCIARLPPDAVLPDWVPEAAWCSITRTAEELSIVCEAVHVPPNVRQQGGWRLLQVAGPLDFALTGVLHRIAAPMADAGVSIFALSTFDTDYVLVSEAELGVAVSRLRKSGIIVSEPV
ncbi:MAG: ACT domain-containing protein [Gammaproteobacteria bacterium]|nr:ACT domain-containing protein [Gammaproteobacteria bacterium]